MSEKLTPAAKAEAQKVLDKLAAELLEQGFRRQPDGTLRVA